MRRAPKTQLAGSWSTANSLTFSVALLAFMAFYPFFLFLSPTSESAKAEMNLSSQMHSRSAENYDRSANKITLGPIFSNGMVIQRNQRVAVWGTHEHPGAVISVSFRDQEIFTTVDERGRWRVHLGPMTATKPSPLNLHTGEVLKVTSGSSITEVHDILVGDVFIASGQSNMDKGGIHYNGMFPAEEKMKYSNFSFDFPNIRWMRLRGLPEYLSLSFPPGAGDRSASHWKRAKWWKISDSTITKANPSMVAFSFCYHLAHYCMECHGVPLGVIEAAFGNTGILSWMRKKELAIAAKVSPSPEAAKQLSSLNEASSQAAQEKLDFSWAEQVERHRGDKKWADTLQRADNWRNAYAAWKNDTGLSAYPSLVQAGNVYSFFLESIDPWSAAGILWYQGEFDGNKGDKYYHWNKLLIQGMREAFGDGTQRAIPFFQVEICPVHHYRDGLAYLREAQRKVAEEVEGVAIVNTNDLGPGDKDKSNVHPGGKFEVGRRLSLLSRKLMFKEDALIARGPQLQGVEFQGKSAVVSWREVADGLKSLDGRPLTFFEVALASNPEQFFSAQANITSKNTVVVSRENQPTSGKTSPIGETNSKSINGEDIVAVRFAFREYAPSNLGNSVNLPAAAFRTDNYTLDFKSCTSVLCENPLCRVCDP